MVESLKPMRGLDSKLFWSTTNDTMLIHRKNLFSLVAMIFTTTVLAEEPVNVRETNIRAGNRSTIVSVKRIPRIPQGGIAGTTVTYPHPRPRFVGFSPLVAITTSDKRRGPFDEQIFEHELENSYFGNPLNGTPDQNFVVGILDSGSIADLIIGLSSITLGVTGEYLTENTVSIVGVGGVIEVPVSQPIGIFAAGLSSVDAFGLLDVDLLVGHTNVSVIATPPIVCGSGEIVNAIIGTPFLAFYNSVIRVDQPIKVHVNGVSYVTPNVSIQQFHEPIPPISHSIPLNFGGSLPPITSAFGPNLIDLEDLETPGSPTLLTFFPGTFFNFGDVFFTTILAIEREPGPTNPAQELNVLVDTGAQSSIISPAVAASLSLPFEPDFTVDVCGLGGVVTDVPGYYIDYIKINAFGSAMEFSKVPFVVLDLQSPTGGSLDGVLGMNFFWNRNVVLEPSLIGSSFFSVSDPIPVAFGDNDVDFDVDQSDAAFIVSCMTAPQSYAVNPECAHLDFDLDDDIDLYDISRFQLCYSGQNQTADTDCGQ